jgi:hypothetical protein
MGPSRATLANATIQGPHPTSVVHQTSTMNTAVKASTRAIVGIAALMTLVLGSAPAAAQTTALFVDSDAGDWVGSGQTHTLVPPDATFQIQRPAFRPNSVSLSVDDGDSWWYVTIAAPGSVPLAAGTYPHATRAPFTRFAGLDVSGNGHGCNELTGRFVVLELVYAADGSILRFAADVEQHCEDQGPALFAAVRYNSTIASLIPFGGNYPRFELSIAPPLHGVVTGDVISCGGARTVCSTSYSGPALVALSATPDPGYLFTGWSGSCSGGATISVNVNSVKACSATFDTILPAAPRTLLTWHSAPGDYIGQGKDVVYSEANSVWTLRPLGGANGLQITVEGDDDRSASDWHLEFRAPVGGQLTPGTYPAAERAPFRTTTPGLEISGNGRGCNMLTGSFTVHELTRNTLGEVTVFSAEFEQHCELSWRPPLTGSIRFNSMVGPAAPLPVVSLSTAKLNFRVAVDPATATHRVLTPPQTVSVAQSAAGPISWTATSRDPWIIVAPSSGTGPATFQVAYREDAYPANAGTFATEVHVSFTGAVNSVEPIAVTVYTLPFHTRQDRVVDGDMDADGAADLTLFRPGDGTWTTRLFSYGFTSGPELPFGLSTDKPVPGDYDGDGRIDMALYRPSNGIWYVIYSTTGALAQLQWGVATDIPMPDDYTGDGRTDLAVWRPSTGVWFIFDLSSGTYTSRQWGVSTDIPLTGDYDGDRLADVAVFRPSSGFWYVFFSSTQTYVVYQWGISTDIPLPADYSGDGLTDLAVYRPSTGVWYVYDLRTSSYIAYQWGVSTDIPVPKDYDGDGRTDLAIWRPSTRTWFVYFLGTNTYISVAHGATGDVPIR